MLEVDAFAKLRAQIERRGELELALRDANLTLIEWLHVERHWLRALDEEEGGEALVQRYLDAYRRELGADGDVEPRAGDAAPEPSPPHVPDETALPTAPRPLLVPSYLQPSAHAATRAQTSSGDHGRAQVAPLPAVVRTGPGGTAELATPRRPPVTLPFETPARPAPAGTMLAEATPSGPALPFARDERLDVPAERAATLTREGTGTVALEAEPATTNQGPEVPSGLPNLNVEQYAWVIATLKRATPETLPATLERLRLTPASRAELEARWRAHLMRFPDLKQAFIRALAHQLASQP